MGKDHTIFAKTEGTIAFKTSRGGRTYVSVVPAAASAK
jgi:large subunit ribosomal protein L27